jgi:hypothetical protein
VRNGRYVTCRDLRPFDTRQLKNQPVFPEDSDTLAPARPTGWSMG